jgi:hypothetical protein
MFWGRHYFKWVVLALAVLGVAAMSADLVLVSARHWRIAGPVLIFCFALAFWGAGRSGSSEIVVEPLGFWPTLGLRLLTTLLILVVGLFALGAVAYLIQLGLENLEISIPFILVAAVLGVMAVWPDKKKQAAKREPRAPKPATSVASVDGDGPEIVEGGGSGSNDIVT